MARRRVEGKWAGGRKAPGSPLYGGLTVHAEAGEPGGVFGEGGGVQDGDAAVAGLYDALALELAHHLGDRLPGGGDHVRQVLVRQAHVDERAAPVLPPEALAEVAQQRRQPRGALPAG